MPTRPSSRMLPRLALLPPLLSLACDPKPPPSTTPDLPQVSVVVDEPNTVGRSLKLSLSTSGCDQVQRLDLLESGALLKQVTYGGNPTPVELGMSELRPYSRGIAARLSLTAQVTCADGRSNLSQAQPATFFPVEAVLEPESANTQVVPDYFVAEGSESTGTLAFIGCANDANGRPWLYKVPKTSPTAVQRLEMGIPCTENTTITDRAPANTGTRWVWTPNEGYFALTPDFRVTGLRTNKDIVAGLVDMVDRLSVTPEGDALVWDEGKGGIPKSLRRVSPTGVTQWNLEGGASDATREMVGFLAGEPVFKNGSIYLPLNDPDFGTNQSTLMVGVVRYLDGGWLSVQRMDTFSPFNAPPPPMAIAPSATELYLARQGTTAPYVKACAINGSTKMCDTSSGNRLWLTELPTGVMAGLVPYANGTRLAAVAASQTWFLDTVSGSPTRGAVVNKDGKPLSPTGALVARIAQPGPGSAFYLFTSPVSTNGQTPYPMELIATDAAEKGELYRYQVPGGSLSGALDDSGALWLRVGRKLVKPLPLELYREVR